MISFGAQNNIRFTSLRHHWNIRASNIISSGLHFLVWEIGLWIACGEGYVENCTKPMLTSRWWIEFAKCFQIRWQIYGQNTKGKCPFTTPHGILPKYPYSKRKELLHEIRFVNSESLNSRSQRRFKGNETKNSGSSEPSKSGGTGWKRDVKNTQNKRTKQFTQDYLIGISRKKVKRALHYVRITSCISNHI